MGLDRGIKKYRLDCLHYKGITHPRELRPYNANNRGICLLGMYFVSFISTFYKKARLFYTFLYTLY